MTKTELETQELRRRIETRLGITIDYDDANALRRAEKTLHAWAKLECGTDRGWIERDEETGKCYRCFDTGVRTNRFLTPDRESGALKRVSAICERYGLRYYHQTDPRGCALYLDTKPIPNNAYTASVSVCV